MLEREAKFVVDDDFIIPDLHAAVAGASWGPTEDRTMVDVYHDTIDLRLARWGCTLRHRTGHGWTVKIPVPSEGIVLQRQEVTVDGPPGRPPAEAVDLVASLTRGAQLGLVAQITGRRVAHPWTSADGSPVAELVDDVVTASTPAGADLSFRELEIELAPGVDARALDDVIARLRDAGADPGPRPKLVRVLGDAALEPPDVVVPQPKRRPRARRVIRSALASSVSQLLLQVPAARLGLDAEGVHQTRVATRRLRSDLRTFEPLLDTEWAQTLRHELAWLADELGRVRDGDVLANRLGELIHAHPEIDRHAANRLLTHLEHERSRDRARLLGHLADERALQLFDHLVTAAREPRTTAEADRRGSEVMPALVRRRWKHLRRAVERLPAQPEPSELHRIRILAKRVRYASEAVTPAVGKSARRFAKAASSIQDTLGDLNDAAVARSWLVGAAPYLDRAAAFAAGQLTQQLTTDALAGGSGWQAAYRRLKRHDDWLR